MDRKCSSVQHSTRTWRSVFPRLVRSIFQDRLSILLLLVALIATQVLFAQTPGQNAVIKDTGGHTTNSPSFFAKNAKFRMGHPSVLRLSSYATARLSRS